MNIALLVKIEVLLGLLSFIGVFGTVLQKGIHVWKFRKLQSESKHLLRNIKMKLNSILDGSSVKKKEKTKVTTKTDSKKRSVTPEDHVEVQKLLRRVDMHLSGNDLENAEKLLVSALCINPEDADANELLAYVYMQRRKFSKAESIYLHLVEKNTQDPAIYGNLGRVLEAQDKNDTAITAYKEAIKRDPHNAARYAQLGKLFIKMKMYSEAVEVLKHADRRSPKTKEYLLLLSQAYEQSGSYMKAGEILLRILDIDPYNVDVKAQIINYKEKGYIKVD